MGIVIRILLNIILVALMSTLLPDSFVVTGGLAAYIVIGFIISILNLLLRPILFVLTLPLRIITHIVASIIVNMLFLYATERAVAMFASQIATLDIQGGFLSWLIVAIAFGFLNWFLKSFMPKVGD